MEDVEEDICVLKIQMSSMEKDVKDVEMSIDNVHMRLEKVEDHVDGLLDQIQRVSQSVSSGTHAAVLEAQRVEKVLVQWIESWSDRLERNHTVINKKFIHLDEELEKVVELAGQKIDVKFGELASNFMEALEIEESHWEVLERRVTSLEEKLEHSISHIACLAGLITNVQTRVRELEDAVMEESMMTTEGDVVESSSSSSTDVDPVENMVADTCSCPIQSFTSP
jgi:chromosome segregation ATPase